MSRPAPTSGMHHVAINVTDLEICEQFYVGLLGMAVEWRPDQDNVYLCSGNDNLALHRFSDGQKPVGPQRLDHIGFILKSPELVDDWYNFLNPHGVKMKSSPKSHRGGARRFYFGGAGGGRKKKKNKIHMISH